MRDDESWDDFIFDTRAEGRYVNDLVISITA